MRLIEEKWLPGMLANERGGTLVQEIGEIAFLMHDFEAVAHAVGAVEVAVMIVVRVAEQGAEVFVEAMVNRIELVLVAEVPFAKGAGRISRGLHELRDAGLGGGQAWAVDVRVLDPFAIHLALLLGGVAHGPLESDPLLPTAGNESATGGRADAGVRVEI